LVSMMALESALGADEARFQSPCAGNMFGKALESALGADEARLNKLRGVSIPVCGEHVW
jgi:hypothetical protein